MAKWRQHLQRRSLRVLGMVSAACLGAIALPSSPPAAVQLSDGTTAFTSPPRLVDFVTFDTRIFDRNPTYYVTVNLLPEAGEPLQTLTVELIEGRFTWLDFRTNDLEVFAGTRRDRGMPYAIAAADFNDDTQTLTIQLAEPAEPGQQLTFVLELVRNPRMPGVYLYEVAAAPAGSQPRFQRVGTGRIHIYERSDPFWP